MLGTIKFVDKSVNDNSVRRLDHCDDLALRSGFGVPTGVPHSEVELQTEFKSFTAAHLGSNTNQHTAWTLGGTCIKSSRLVYAPHLVQSVRLHLFKYRGGDNAHWISKNKMAAMAVQWELCGVIMGIMTGLLWCCSSSTLGSRANDYIKTLATLLLWLHQIALLPQVLDEQQPRSPVITPKHKEPSPDQQTWWACFISNILGQLRPLLIMLLSCFH